MSTTIPIKSGDDYIGTRRLRIEVATNGVAEDITGATLTWMAKRVRTDLDADAAILKTTADGIETTEADEGIALITLTEADTEDLAGRYVWELEADDAIGKVTLASGLLFVAADLIE